MPWKVKEYIKLTKGRKLFTNPWKQWICIEVEMKTKNKKTFNDTLELTSKDKNLAFFFSVQRFILWRITYHYGNCQVHQRSAKKFSYFSMTEIPWNIFFPKYVLESSRELATIFYSEIAQKVGICQDRDDDQPYFKSCPLVAAISYFLLSIMKELWWAKLELVTWSHGEIQSHFSPHYAPPPLSSHFRLVWISPRFFFSFLLSFSRLRQGWLFLAPLSENLLIKKTRL